MSNQAHLRGRIFITCSIQAVTGLHIGGSSTGLEIGGVDNTIIRDALSGAPYIPGSSLRGKMRSQLEKTLGKPQNYQIGDRVHIHCCDNSQSYFDNEGCPICHIFGVPGDTEKKIPEVNPTNLIVRDAPLTEASKKDLEKAHTDLKYTEVKTEVAIDRVTSAPTPRTLERVPAGAVFGPAELVFSIYQPADFNRLRHVVDGLQLLEDDYLGGYGSRGSGKVRFAEIQVTARSSQSYSQLQTFQTFAALKDLEAAFNDLLNWSKKVIPIS